METPIKPGKYKMRNGLQAIVVAVAPVGINARQPLIGWIPFGDGKWCGVCWHADGAFYVTREIPSPFDLISPWIDAPVFNHWDTAPWAKALYKYSRSWILSSFIPVWDDKVEDWHHPKQNSPFTYRLTCHLIPDHYPNWVGPDKDSLILRPENV